MIGTIFNMLFKCSHSRLTRPITPVSKPGVASGETYVVCLDCGKQFAYDWNHMRIGKQIDRSSDSGVLQPEMPGGRKAKMKYALFGSAIPLAVLLGSVLVTKRRATAGLSLGDRSGTPAPRAELDQHIDLPHGGPGAQFRLHELIQHIEQSDRTYIIIGDLDCALADHPKPSSLDYWLRESFAKNKETKQATSKVITQLMATGLFEQLEDLRCPDSGSKCKGLRLKSRVAEQLTKNSS
jgi:hypothetical protein